MSGKSTTRIYVDMDGVLADFDKHFENTHNMHPSAYEKAHGTEAFWKSIIGTDKYWENIPPFPYAQEMLDFIFEHFEHVSILSAPSNSDYERTIREKRTWLNKNVKMPCGTHVPAIFRKDKHVYAAGGAILIDDFENKVKKWNSHGGFAIHHKNWEDTKRALETLLERERNIIDRKVVVHFADGSETVLYMPYHTVMKMKVTSHTTRLFENVGVKVDRIQPCGTFHMVEVQDGKSA